MKYISNSNHDMHQHFGNELVEQTYYIVVNSEGQWEVLFDGEFGYELAYCGTFSSPVEAANTKIEQLSQMNNLTWKYDFDDKFKRGILIVRMLNDYYKTVIGAQ